jgi:anti-sigma regulatory factor (Ser/Thr protein kinase)
VGRACERWALHRLRDVAELVVTELVGNVLRHAGTDMEVAVARDRRSLHISVRDRGPGLPRLGGRDTGEGLLREDGRGLLVISALTYAWGCIPVPDGKVVWATIRY